MDGCNWVQVGRGMRVGERHGGCTWVGAWLDRGVLTSSFRLTGCRMAVRRKEEMQCGIRCGCQLGSVDAWCIQGGMRGMVCGRDIVATGRVVYGVLVALRSQSGCEWGRVRTGCRVDTRCIQGVHGMHGVWTGYSGVWRCSVGYGADVWYACGAGACAMKRPYGVDEWGIGGCVGHAPG